MARDVHRAFKGRAQAGHVTVAVAGRGYVTVTTYNVCRRGKRDMRTAFVTFVTLPELRPDRMNGATRAMASRGTP